MSTVEQDVQKLKAGEHYGAVFNKRRTDTAVYSETLYDRKLDLPEHSHELGFFTLILDGYYSEIVNRKNMTYAPQTVLWRQAELSHKDKIEAVSSRFFFVEIQQPFAKRLRECESVPDRLAEQNGQLTWLMARLRSEIVSGDASSSLIAEGITLEMLGNLTRNRRTIEKRPPKWLLRVIDRLNEDFTGEISSEELGREANVHPVHLAAVFRQFYHETIGDHVQKLRVGRATQMLMDRETPLCEIAYTCGFSDQSHFTRVFKRRVGITPGAFRSSLS